MTLNLAFPLWVLILAAVLGFGSVFMLVRRSHLFRSARERWLVIGLRLVVVVLLLLVMADPVQKRAAGEPDQEAPALLLVDTSASMGVGGEGTRLASAQVALAEALDTKRLAGRAQVLPFAGELSATPVEADQVPALSANGPATQLGASLSRAVQMAAGVRSRRIVVFSDGRTQDREKLGDVALAARRARVNISVYPLGSLAEQADARIVNCRVERHVPANSRVPVEVEVGLVKADGQTIRLQLRDDEGQVVDEVSFVAGAENAVRKTLTFKVERENRSLHVQLAPLDGESNEANNRFAFEVTVSDPKLRVLYMEGTNHKDKRWPEMMDYDFIPAALKEAGNIDVDILTVDEQLATGGRLFRVDDEARGYPTTKEELFGYDVVICSDINRSIFSEDQLEWTRQLVAENGGGFVMIGGYTAFGAGGWDKTVWEQLIPVDMATQAEGYVWEDIKVDVPPAARRHPIWHLAEDEAENDRIIDAHPILKGSNLVKRAKPGAQMLAYWEEKDMPLICVQSYGKGRSMAFTSDAAGGWSEFYQTEWGEHDGDRDNRHYRRFWLNAIRWLAENSLASHRTEFIANADALQYRPSESVRLRARLRLLTDPAVLRPLKVTAKLADGSGVSATLELDPARGEFVGDFPLPAGISGNQAAIQVTAVTPENKPVGEETVIVGLDHTSLELAETEPDHPALETLAELTEGEVLADAGDLRDLLNRAVDRPEPGARRYSVPMWDNAWLWLLALLMMSAEWFYRKALRFR
jgi:uncharacterized membrane protein